jgi:hypothetical protein
VRVRRFWRCDSAVIASERRVRRTCRRLRRPYAQASVAAGVSWSIDKKTTPTASVGGLIKVFRQSLSVVK